MKKSEEESRKVGGKRSEIFEKVDQGRGETKKQAENYEILRS